MRWSRVREYNQDSPSILNKKRLAALIYLNRVHALQATARSLLFTLLSFTHITPYTHLPPAPTHHPHNSHPTHPPPPSIYFFTHIRSIHFICLVV